MSTICILTDFSDASRRAYPVAERLARQAGAELNLVHVTPVLPPVPATAAAPLPAPPVEAASNPLPDLEHAQARIEEEREHFTDGAALSTVVLAGEKVDETVTEHAAKTGAEFLVLATHGRSGVRRLLLGSVAESILRRAVTPVVVVPTSGA